MTNRILLLSIIVFSLLLSCEDEKITNPKPDAVKYDTVKICNQVWMTKNLDVDHYRNGDPIPEVSYSNDWRNLTTGAWCYYHNDPAMGKICGRLYNWYAVNDPRGLAPEGWHVATDTEWKELEMCLGMSYADAHSLGSDRGTDQGSQLAGWAYLWAVGLLTSNPKFGASGFSALPGGWRYDDGTFGFIGYRCGLWSATDSNATYAWDRGMFFNYSLVHRYYSLKGMGLSVRCVKD